VGDTTWHGEVEQALAAFKPDVVVLNTGDARVLGFTGSIIMGRDDVLRAARAAPEAAIVATHMDAINHMTLSREVLRDHVPHNGLVGSVRVPADGETMAFCSFHGSPRDHRFGGRGRMIPRCPTNERWCARHGPLSLLPLPTDFGPPWPSMPL